MSPYVKTSHSFRLSILAFFALSLTSFGEPLFHSDLHVDNCYVDIVRITSHRTYQATHPFYEIVMDYHVYDCECMLTDCDSSATSLSFKDFADLYLENVSHPHHFLFREGIYGDTYNPDWVDSYNYLLLTSVASGACSGKSSLQSIRLPDTVKQIGDGAFSNCTNLTSVTIPNSVTNIEGGVFSGCPKLTSISCASGGRYVSVDGVLYNSTKTKLIKYPEGKTDRFFVVPETVTELAPYCFANTKLVAVQFLGDCPTMPSTSFRGSKCVLYHDPDADGWPEPSSGWYGILGQLDTDCFTFPLSQSGSLGSYTWNGVEIVDGVAWCYRIEDGEATVIYVPDKLETQSLAIPNILGGRPVTAICDDFSQPDSVVSLSIPASVSEIGWAPFSGNQLEWITVDPANAAFHAVDGVLIRNDNTLIVCPSAKPGDYSIPEGIVSVWANAFNHCHQITSIHIPASVTDAGVFGIGCGFACLSISVDADNTVYSSIGGCLFSKDGKTLHQIPRGMTGAYSIPEGVETIGEQAFMFGRAIDLMIPASMKEIPPFGWSTGIQTVSVSESNTLYHVQDNVLFSDADSTLLWCSPTKTGEYVVPDGVQRIAHGAFAYVHLTNIVLSGEVKSIGSSAFLECSDLVTIELSESLTSIGEKAFDKCSALQSVTIPYSIQNSLGDWNLPEGCQIIIHDPIPLAIETETTLSFAYTEISYGQPVVASGGLRPYAWEIVDMDDWPDWLSTWDIEEYGCLSGCPYSENIGTSTFALRVTDAEGSTVVKTFTLEVVENPNPPPVIDSSSPDAYYVHIEPGRSQTFSVEAHDPKGDALTFLWSWSNVDDWEDRGEGTGTSFSFSSGTEGVYEVVCRVSDGTNDATSSWEVKVGYAKTIYVDQASTVADPDGTSWATAYPTLGDAQGDIEEGDTVLVAPGTYSCPYLPEDIELRSRDGAAATSITGILSGGGLTVVGFTFEGIRYSYPAPMPYPIVSPGSKLVGCVIRGCSSDGGLLNDCELEDCIVSDCESASDLIDGCDLANCAVVGNTSGYDILSGCRLWNCTVAGNTLLSWYDALDQSCSAWNSILWGNYNVEELEYEWPWPSSVSYGFWWDDATGDYTDLHMAELHDCCIEGIWNIALTLQNEYGMDYDPDALGLIEELPDFVDLAHGDVRLRTGSSCVDAGSNAWVHGTTDVAGNPRIQGVAVDLGAFEGAVDGFVLSVRVVGAGTVSPMTAIVPAGGSATFTASESAGRPFVGWTTNGVAAGNAATLALANIRTDGTIMATFGSFSFFVDAATGDDTNDGLSWENAMATIQAAVEVAVDDESILVKPGSYGPIDAAGKAVRIESTAGKSATFIDGGGTNRCAFLGSGVGRGATLSGFTLRNGNAAWNASPKAGMGGGAYGGTLFDCDITSCEAYEEGGGVAYSEAHRCRIVGNGIFDGDDWAYGGGAYESDLYSCLVASNSIVLSISPDDTTPSAKAYGGGAAWGTLYQCTVADNSILSEDMATGGGWYADWGELNGSIFYGNTANGVASDVENWEGPVSFEQSLVGVDPLFVDRANGDYRLRQDSPAVDAGFSSTYEWRGPPSESITDLDLDRNPRVRGLCIDLGCYESAFTASSKETMTTPEPVPYAWLNENATNAVKGAWGGYEDAAKATAKNGRPVWECYVADLDPENENDDLVADIEMVNGQPVVTILKGEKASREYETQGAPAPGGPWGHPDENSRFFRVKVSLP